MGWDGVREEWYFSILSLVEVEAKLEGESENGYIVFSVESCILVATWGVILCRKRYLLFE